MYLCLLHRSLFTLKVQKLQVMNWVWKYKNVKLLSVISIVTDPEIQVIIGYKYWLKKSILCIPIHCISYEWRVDALIEQTPSSHIKCNGTEVSLFHTVFWSVLHNWQHYFVTTYSVEPFLLDRALLNISTLGITSPESPFSPGLIRWMKIHQQLITKKYL